MGSAGQKRADDCGSYGFLAGTGPEKCVTAGEADSSKFPPSSSGTRRTTRLCLVDLAGAETLERGGNEKVQDSQAREEARQQAELQRETTATYSSRSALRTTVIRRAGARRNF